MPIDKNLLEEYLETKKKLDLLKDGVFSWLTDICKLCTDIGPYEKVANFYLSENPVYSADEPEVIVNVTSYNYGEDTYYFPKRYLDMTPNEIKKDVERMKKLEEEEEQRTKTDAEYKQYLRLKKQFEKSKD